MNKHQHGIGALQLVVAVAAIAIIAIVGPPQYRSYKDRAQVSDAFTLATESQQRLFEFYSINTRFPETADEAEFARSLTQPMPAIVRDLIVEPGPKSGEVTVKILLRDGVIENPGDGEQFIYIAGSTKSGSGFSVEWTCGARGVENLLLPEQCRG